MKGVAPALNPLFRSDTQGRLLAAVLGDPDREQSLTELATAAGTSVATAGREIDRAAKAGIVRARRQGNTRLVRADPTHRLYRSLAELVTATWGVPAVIAEEFGGLDGVDGLVIFGSWAARWHGDEGRAPNDVDVLVLGAPSRDAVDDAAERAQAHLQIPVQATMRPLARWWDREDPFMVELRSRPVYVVIPVPEPAGAAS